MSGQTDPRSNRSDMQRIEAQLAALAESFSRWQLTITQRLAEVGVLVSNKRDLCPFREDIAQAANHVRRLEALEKGQADQGKTIHQMQIDAARSGALGGLAGGGVVTIVAGIIYGAIQLAQKLGG